MAWSLEQDRRDQAAQWVWVGSWPGWDSVPAAYAGEGWNALHEQGGGGWQSNDGPAPWSSGIPVRYFEPADPNGKPIGGWS